MNIEIAAEVNIECKIRTKLENSRKREDVSNARKEGIDHLIVKRKAKGKILTSNLSLGIKAGQEMSLSQNPLGQDQIKTENDIYEKT